MRNFLLYCILFCFLFNQDLVTNPHDIDLFIKEINALKECKISEELFLKPYIRKIPKKNKPINITKDLIKDKKFVLEPIVSFRFGNNGFEMSDINSKAYWFTPGMKMSSIIPILNQMNSIWLYSWTEFYKHSSVFEKGVNNPKTLFNYNPDYSIGFYTSSIEPSNGFDFDQSQGGISLLSNKFEFIFGKFNTSFGPFYRGNLSISNNAPPLDQILIKFKDEKFIFSYMIASLDSNLPRFHPSENIGFNESDLYKDLWTQESFDDAIMSNYTGGDRFSSWERYVAYHRLDFYLKDNIRIGAYEKIIFGARNIPMSYIIPVLPFWSSQHESGDLDNLMLGFDFDIAFDGCFLDPGLYSGETACRIYGALLIDEWAPYSTFTDDHRNWFAWQVGYSKYGKIFKKYFLYKMEYSRIGPGVYNHRFIINEPKHHGYNLGFWSGNHSDDFLVSLVLLLNNDRFIKISNEITRFSDTTFEQKMDNLESQYSNNLVDFSKHGFNNRNKLSIVFSSYIKYGIFFDLELSSFKTKGLYSIDGFTDITMKIRYNIFK